MSPRILRLTGPQYISSIRQLLPEAEPVDVFQGDTIPDLYEYSTDPSFFLLGDRETESIFAESDRLAKTHLAGVASALGCRDADRCIGAFVDSFATRAFRRPLRAGDAEHFVEIYRNARAQLDPEDALEVVVRVILSSPDLVFRWELGDPESGKADAFEIASALSYPLTDAPPDAELMALADSGQLLDDRVLQDQIRRLMRASKHRQTVRFLGEYFEYTSRHVDPKDPEHFPEFSDALVQGLIADANALAAQHLADGASLADLLTTDYSMVQESTKAIYGVDRALGDGHLRVPTPARTGMLSQPAVLNAFSLPRHNNPTIYGVMIRDRLLCFETPAPPENLEIPSLDELNLTVGPNTPLREVLAMHVEHAQCRACHQYTDPLGFAFESFDPIGRVRTGDVDSSGVAIDVDGRDIEFGGHKELMTALAATQSTSSCFAKNALFFYAGLDLTHSEGCFSSPRAGATRGSIEDDVAHVLARYLLARKDSKR